MIYANSLPCKMQMLQIVALHGDYQYQIAHFIIINLTQSKAYRVKVLLYRL